MEAAAENVRQTARSKPLLHAGLFVIGFSIIFVAVGLTASGIGRLVFDLREPLARVGGSMVMLLGLASMGLLGDLSRRLERLEHAGPYQGGKLHLTLVRAVKKGIDVFLRYFYADTRFDMSRYGSGGYLSSFLLGVFFSAGWTPCIGPTLGAILALSSTTATIWQGAWLLVGYSLGLGIPFLVFAATLERADRLFRSLTRHLRAFQMVTGAFLLLIGFALFTNQLTAIARWAQEHRLYMEAGPIGESAPTFSIAVLAGLLSFCLPVSCCWCQPTSSI